MRKTVLNNIVIVSLVVSLLIISIIPTAYATIGDFISLFEGTGIIKFDGTMSIAVDSNDRIIVSDTYLNRVIIYDPVESKICTMPILASDTIILS